MNTYKDFFIDIDSFNEENISYVKPVLFYKASRNMGVYYTKKQNEKQNKKNKEKTKKQKIIIKTPKMIIPFGVKEFDNSGKKSYKMSLSFSTLTNLYNEEEIKKFYKFIQKIDTVNEETILDYKKKWNLPKDLKYKKTLQRLSSDYPHYMNVSLPHDERVGFLFNTYDDKANKAGIDILEKRSVVSVVMELTDLKFTDTDFRSNWTVLQIRRFKPYSPIQEFFMSGCFIGDDDDPEDIAYVKLIEKYSRLRETPIHIPHIPQLNSDYNSQIQFQIPSHGKNNTKEKTSESNVKPFVPPTLQELLNAKKLLKKTQTVEKTLKCGRVLSDDKDKSTSNKKKKITKQETIDDEDIPPPPPPPPDEPETKTKNTSPENISLNTESTKPAKLKNLPKKPLKPKKPKNK